MNAQAEAALSDLERQVDALRKEIGAYSRFRNRVGGMPSEAEFRASPEYPAHSTIASPQHASL